MDDADVLNELKHWNEMGEPFVPEVSVRAGDPRVADLLQTVADAATEAQKKVLDANLALNLVIIAVGEYGRLAFGDDYLDNLCTTLQRLRGKVPPDRNSH